MALQRLPVRQTTEQRATAQRFELEGVPYRFGFRYAAKTSRWYLTIANDAETVQVASVKLVLGIDLLKNFHHLEVPPGQLFCYDTTGSNVEPGLDDFDARVWLLYRPSTEVVT